MSLVHETENNTGKKYFKAKPCFSDYKHVSRVSWLTAKIQEKNEDVFR